MKKCLSTLLLAGLASGSLFASSTPSHTIVAPDCLANKLGSANVISKHQDLQLIRTDQAGINALAEAKYQSKNACGGFMDVSEEWQAWQAKNKLAPNANNFLVQYKVKQAKYKSEATFNAGILKHKKTVKVLFNTASAENMWTNLTTLTSFQDRYADSDNGVKAAEWLKDQALSMAAQYNRSDVSARFVKTGWRYKQPSVVVKVGNSNKAGVVIGGHMDTLSSSWPSFGNNNNSNNMLFIKPGADDDGSGTVTVLETLRTVLASDIKFDRPIYFIWYAAEEMGLVGSKYVVQDFKDANIPVKAVLHLDMTGYAYNNEKTMWLVTDNVDMPLTAYLEKLITDYVERPVDYLECGYACSDHATWTKGGFTAASPFESSFRNHNPYIHTSNDTMDNLSLDHMTDYLKLALAFVGELADPVEFVDPTE